MEKWKLLSGLGRYFALGRKWGYNSLNIGCILADASVLWWDCEGLVEGPLFAVGFRRRCGFVLGGSCVLSIEILVLGSMR